MAVRTVRDLLNATYGQAYADGMLRKLDDPVLSTEAGYSNAVFGGRAFINVAFSTSTFGVLAKDAYGGENPDGMRLLYATGSTSTGISENASLPDTDKSDVLEATVGFKEEVSTFEITKKAIMKARANDYYDLNQELELRGTLHTSGINGHLNTDADTLAGYNTESIDRMTISEAAVTALSYTAGDNDMYSLDIGTYTWFDPICDHNSGVDRAFDFGYIYKNSASVRNNNGITQKIITKPDTYGQMMANAQAQIRYAPAAELKYTMTEEGAKINAGGSVGYPVASIDGAAVFQDSAVQADTIGRIYLIDDSVQFGSPQVSLNIAAPTMLQTANNAPLLDAVKEKSMYYTALELRCRSRFRQDSIRDLKAGAL